MNNYARRLARRIKVESGIARKVEPSVLFVSEDRRAVLINIDTCTKYLGVSPYMNTEGEIGVMLYKDERTLRWNELRAWRLDDDRATVVTIPLPRIKGRWFWEAAPTKYGCLIYAICVPMKD